MGIDEQSKGVRVYWPDTRTVGIERNVYVDKTGASASHLEGEDWDGFGETSTDAPVIYQNPSNIPISSDPDDAQKSDDPTPVDPPHDIPSDTDETPETPPEPVERPKRTRKPTERVRDLISGKAVSDYRPKLGRKIATGVQLPTEINPQPDEPAPVGHDENEGGRFANAADFAEELCMVSEMRESEGLEPRNLKEAQRGLDWLACACTVQHICNAACLAIYKQ